MPAVWFALKRSLHCRSEPSEVHDPKVNNGNLSNILTKKSGGGGRSGCSRSISNLKDVIHGSKRYMEKPPTCSPRSIGSSEFLNPITHEVVFSDSTCEIKITGVGGAFQESSSCHGGGSGGSSAFGGTLKLGTPGPGGHNHSHTGSSTVPRNTARSFSRKEVSGINGVPSNPRGTFRKDSLGFTSTCHKCGEQFAKWEAVEAHHLSKHAVTELVEGDSSRKIVELICRTGWSKSDNNYGNIERILKVHNMQKTIARFEEYREMVKIKASKLQKKHPRCLADGNELLRFYGMTVECPLGTNGSSSLCLSDRCNVCRILRHGFSAKKELKGGIVGVFTTSTSGRALESIELRDDNSILRKALIVCRVIAGRVHRPLENFQELTSQSGFDSLAGKMGLCSNIEELFLLSPRALLPCFVVIFKP
ncbi:Zinc finger, C2H2 protein [Actinidia chinensis var. chinensis]|uniref:Zinc finger, C2H2 protein n=1 Tax=Actinidia chinensis var. chinensis TaxID=1590841 RepID=A0A2R6RAY9_ACTCC|nr:Zinc finger, C2H2 protein [Actinidia chinensis var. chinensis]